VTAAAEYHPENINRLFLKEERLGAFKKLCKDMAARKRPYKICGDEELEKICKSAHHQGVVAMIFAPEIEPLRREDLDAWADGGKTGLVLHSVGNDHNLGAIVRAAAFFDAAWVVVAEEDMEVSTSACRVAEGGMEHVTLRRVKDTAAFLRDASKRLITIAADTRARRRLVDLPLVTAEVSKKIAPPGGGRQGRPGIAVVLGNEETGLPQEVREACSASMRIPGTGLMESLNVAQAAALFLHQIFEL